MKVLLDESTPRRLALSFPGSIETRTVQQMGWAGCANGELLRLPAEHGFDALVTVDKGFAYQQNVNVSPGVAGPCVDQEDGLPDRVLLDFVAIDLSLAG